MGLKESNQTNKKFREIKNILGSGEIEAIFSESKRAKIPPAVLNSINAHMELVEPMYQMHDFCCTQIPTAH